MIIGLTKFTHGAWIVVVLIPCMIALFLAIRRHYDEVALQLSVEGVGAPAAGHAGTPSSCLVGDVHRGMLPAIEYARALSPSARGVYVEVDPEQTRRFEERWARYSDGMPLVVLRSPYRSVTGPAPGVPGSPPAPGAATSWSRSCCPSSCPRAGGSTCSTTRRRS